MLKNLGWIVTQPERILLRRQIVDLIDFFPGDVLDVGGGDGRRYRDLMIGTSFISLDIDPTAGPDIIASADQMPIDSNSIDTVFSSQMLEHVMDPAACLQEMNRVLRIGGRLVITVPQNNELHSEPRDYWRFTNFGMRLLLEQNGFKIERILKRGGYSTCIAQIRIRRLIDSLKPYENPFWLLVLSPVSRIYTRIAILADKFYQSPASQKHALGWAILAHKEEGQVE